MDTAGQEKYRALAQIFYRNVQVIGLVYSIDRLESFTEIKKYWYPQILLNSPKDVIVMLIANKDDLYEEEVVNEIEAQKFAQSINAIYVRTSALSGSNIEKIFEYIAELFLPQDVQLKQKSGNIDLYDCNTPKDVTKKKWC